LACGTQFQSPEPALQLLIKIVVYDEDELGVLETKM